MSEETKHVDIYLRVSYENLKLLHKLAIITKMFTLSLQLTIFWL